MTHLDVARKAISDRYDDLRWCNKDDLCYAKAEGVVLALADFDDVVADLLYADLHTPKSYNRPVAIGCLMAILSALVTFFTLMLVLNLRFVV